MNTDELVQMLARGLEPTPPGVAQRRWTLALAASVPVAACLMLITLGLRPDLLQVATLPMFWLKLALPLALCAGALRVAARLARPGATLGASAVWLVIPVAVIWSVAAFALLGAAPATRPALLFGETWQACPLYIASLSVPMLLATLWALRGLAPTRLRLAGAAAGLLSGAAAAGVYALHCPELAAPFIAVWYVLGMLLPAVVGALVGPRVLRW
jgi:hypothetical protein